MGGGFLALSNQLPKNYSFKFQKTKRRKSKHLSLRTAFLALALFFISVFANLSFAPPTYASASHDAKELCSDNISWGIDWIFCPIVAGAVDMFESVYGLASHYLSIPPSIFEGIKEDDGTTRTAGLSTSWESFRDLANIVFVIFFLVIIISQLTGFGIDNYGIKRSLPRLVVTVILVNLSFIICRMAVDVSNILGASLNGLMSDMATTIHVTDHGANAIALTVQEATEVGTVWIAFGTALNFGMFALLVLIMLLGVIAVIILWAFCIARDVLVIVLVCLAPLAFVLYMMPNTESWFKKWLDAFKAMLLIYPTCSLAMGSGKLLCSVFTGILPADNLLSSLVPLISLFIPFFAIPFIILNSMKALGKAGEMMKRTAIRGAAKGARASVAAVQPLRNFRPIQSSIHKLSDGKFGNGLSSDGKAGRKYARGRFDSAKTNFANAKEETTLKGKVGKYARGVGAGVTGAVSGVLGVAAGVTGTVGQVGSSGLELVTDRQAAGFYQKQAERRAKRAEAKRWVDPNFRRSQQQGRQTMERRKREEDVMAQITNGTGEFAQYNRGTNLGGMAIRLANLYNQGDNLTDAELAERGALTRQLAKTKGGDNILINMFRDGVRDANGRVTLLNRDGVNALNRHRLENDDVAAVFGKKGSVTTRILNDIASEAINQHGGIDNIDYAYYTQEALTDISDIASQSTGELTRFGEYINPNLVRQILTNPQLASIMPDNNKQNALRNTTTGRQIIAEQHQIQTQQTAQTQAQQQLYQDIHEIARRQTPQTQRPRNTDEQADQIRDTFGNGDIG